MKDLVIIGNQHFAEIVHYYVTSDSDWNVVAFCVNQKYIKESNFLGLPVIALEELSKTHPPENYAAIMGTGYSKLNKIRQNLYEEIEILGYDLPSFIHSTNSIAKNSKVGKGSILFENNSVHPFTEIGNNVIFWSNNVAGHDSIVKDHCFISSRVVFGGNSTIEERSLLGGGCIVAPGVNVGKDCLIGAGALLLTDAEDGGVFQGQASRRSKVPSNKLRVY